MLQVQRTAMRSIHSLNIFNQKPASPKQYWRTVVKNKDFKPYPVIQTQNHYLLSKKSAEEQAVLTLRLAPNTIPRFASQIEPSSSSSSVRLSPLHKRERGSYFGEEGPWACTDSRTALRSSERHAEGKSRDERSSLTRKGSCSTWPRPDANSPKRCLHVDQYRPVKQPLESKTASRG
jgi:hypothetical protein